MRRFLVAGNWKMHGSQLMTTKLISAVAKYLNLPSNNADLMYDVLFCPPAPYLKTAQDAINDLPFHLGGQNVSSYEQGAYTGEVSLAMLNDFACDYVLIGHSERRKLYSENDSQVADKFAACLENSSITPILCVGETLAERQSGKTEIVISSQLDAVLDVVGINGFHNAVIAYEPVWAIGTGETATPMQAQKMHAKIRSKLANLNKEIADKTRILYGGSVKPTNAKELFVAPDIDGGLIGGAALDAQSFTNICQVVQAIIDNQ